MVMSGELDMALDLDSAPFVYDEEDGLLKDSLGVVLASVGSILVGHFIEAALNEYSLKRSAERHGAALPWEPSAGDTVRIAWGGETRWVVAAVRKFATGEPGSDGYTHNFASDSDRDHFVRVYGECGERMRPPAIILRDTETFSMYIGAIRSDLRKVG